MDNEIKEVEQKQEEVIEKKTFDEVLGDKDYQSEFDKRISKALETSKAKWQEEFNSKLEAEKTEAEKLAKMDEAQKHAYELEEAKKRADEALTKLNSYELEKQAISSATEKGVDISLLAMLDFSKENAETVIEKIDTIKVTFDKAVENALNERLKQKAPVQKETLDDTIDPFIQGFRSV